jgi:hypothetical protein
LLFVIRVIVRSAQYEMPYMRWTRSGRTSTASSRGTVVMSSIPSSSAPRNTVLDRISTSRWIGVCSAAVSTSTSNACTCGTSRTSSATPPMPSGSATPKSITSCTIV